MLSKLQAVLDRAHRGHTYISDAQLHGVLEHWDIALVGDCDSFALWCRAELAAQGITTDLILCRTETGEGHLVCSANGYILDNRRKWVTPRNQLPYTWLSAGSPDGTWRRIIA